MKISIEELDKKVENFDVSEWYSADAIAWPDNIDAQLAIMEEYNNGKDFDELPDTDDQIYTDYIISYLNRNRLQEELLPDLLCSIRFVSSRYHSTYPIELLSGYFVDIVDGRNISKALTKLRSFYEDSSPFLKISWRNFIYDVARIAEWPHEKVTHNISDEQYSWLASLFPEITK